MRTTRSARVTASHSEDGAGLVHHGLGDRRVAALGCKSLDRALGHRTNEAGDALEPRRRRGIPRDGRGLRRFGRAAECRRERTGAAALGGALEGVGPRTRHRRAEALERLRAGPAAAGPHAPGAAPPPPPTAWAPPG